MQNYVQPGKRLATYNSSSTVTAPAGTPMVLGNRIRIPLADILPLTFGEAAAEEVFALPAKSDDTWADNATLYWDAGNGWLTVESTSVVAGGAVGAKAGGVTVASVKLPCDPVAATTTGLTQQAHIADEAAITGATPTAQTQDALTLTSMTGTANTAPAAETNMHAIAVNGVGTPSNSTMAAVTELGNAGSADLAPVQNNFATLATELATQKALNTVLINDAKTFATELNKVKTDVANRDTQITALVADVTALRSKINAILASDEAAGVRASS
jgi:predicted RecA/RadA family phage recombinase